MATFEVISLLTKDGVNPNKAIEIIQKKAQEEITQRK